MIFITNNVNWLVSVMCCRTFIVSQELSTKILVTWTWVLKGLTFALRAASRSGTNWIDPAGGLNTMILFLPGFKPQPVLQSKQFPHVWSKMRGTGFGRRQGWFWLCSSSSPWRALRPCWTFLAQSYCLLRSWWGVQWAAGTWWAAVSRTGYTQGSPSSWGVGLPDSASQTLRTAGHADSFCRCQQHPCAGCRTPHMLTWVSEHWSQRTVPEGCH